MSLELHQYSNRKSDLTNHAEENRSHTIITCIRKTVLTSQFTIKSRCFTSLKRHEYRSCQRQWRGHVQVSILVCSLNRRPRGQGSGGSDQSYIPSKSHHPYLQVLVCISSCTPTFQAWEPWRDLKRKQSSVCRWLSWSWATTCSSSAWTPLRLRCLVVVISEVVITAVAQFFCSFFLNILYIPSTFLEN